MSEPTEKEILEQWLALETTPAWSKLVLDEVLVSAHARPLVQLQGELQLAIRLCEAAGEKELRELAADAEWPQWFRAAVATRLKLTDTWSVNRHVSDLRTVLALVVDRLGIAA